jgi:pimeloyl-ACP methyl ester carboxylesterase
MAEALSDGLRISYDDAGQEEPALLCMPGWCSSRAVFERLMPLAAERRRALALDWRGHGASDPAPGDFGNKQLVEDALSVIEASGVERIVPVTQAHSGWVALELRRRLGGRVPRLVLVSWIVLEPPPAFLQAVEAMAEPATWQEAREQLFSMWLEGVDHPEVVRLVREDMASYGFDCWSRGSREIRSAYAAAGSPLAALSAFQPSVPSLYLYAQPADPGYLSAQQRFASEHEWFDVRMIDARSHFPTLEAPEQVVAAVEDFVTDPGTTAG